MDMLVSDDHPVAFLSMGAPRGALFYPAAYFSATHRDVLCLTSLNVAETGSDVRKSSQQGEWAPCLLVPSFLSRQAKSHSVQMETRWVFMHCWFCPCLWEGDEALGIPAFVVGPSGGAGGAVPAADPDQPLFSWDCHDTKDSERCGILIAAFRPLRATW